MLWDLEKHLWRSLYYWSRGDISIWFFSHRSIRTEEVAGKKLNETSRKMTSGKEIFVVGNRKCRRLKSSHEVDMWRDVVSKDKNDLASVRNFLNGLDVFYNEMFNDWMKVKFQKIYIDIHIYNKLIIIENIMYIIRSFL